MYKIFIGIIVFSSLFNDIYGQTKSSWYLSVDNGVVMPVGKFANKEYTVRTFPKSEVNGLALPGFQFNLSGGYHLTRGIAVHSQIGYAINRQSTNSYADFYSRNLATPYTVSVSAKSWKVFKAMLGVKAQQVIGKKNFFIEERILAGISKTKEPGYQVETVSGPLSQLQVFQYKESSKNLPLAFAWQLDIGLGYNLNNKIFLLVNMNYFDSRPQYKFIYYPPPISSQSPFDSKFVYRLSNVGITGSVGIRF